MGKSSAPAAPDYSGQAKAQAQGNLDLAKYTTQANRINQTNPYGSLQYSKSVDPTTGQETWSQSTQFSPEQQQLFDFQNQMVSGALPGIQSQFSQPFDMQSVQDIADKAYGNYTSRLDPQWNQRQSQLETQLANQGVARGTEAYTNAMRDFNAGRNDAYTQAQTASFNLMPQTYNLAASARNQPLNELTAMRSALSPTMPSFPGFAQQNQTAGPDLLNAANAQYQNQLASTNASNAQQSQNLMGLMSLGALAFSDARLKTNIQRIGTHPLGIGIYSYEKFGNPEIGVLAQEVETVLPEAVVTHPSGYKMVNYGML